MKKQSLRLAKLSAALAVAACLSAGTASAQSLAGDFTLPYEVRWGSLVLPAGQYTIELDSAGRFGKLSTRSGGGRGFVMAKAIDGADKDYGTALLLTRDERQVVVRGLNWPEANKLFVYKPFSKAELSRRADARPGESLPIRIAAR